MKMYVSLSWRTGTPSSIKDQKTSYEMEKSFSNSQISKMEKVLNYFGISEYSLNSMPNIKFD